MSADQGLLAVLGIRTRQVADLDEGALYIADRSLLLLDIELSDHRVKAAVDYVLAEIDEDEV